MSESGNDVNAGRTRSRGRRAMDLGEPEPQAEAGQDMEPSPIQSDEEDLPDVEEIQIEDLCTSSDYTFTTLDGWTLNISRYEPKRQRFSQPIFGQPILLVHGFSENNSCWTSGQFLKNMLFFGADLHLLELRGHGKSNAARQVELFDQRKGKLPADLDYGWDIDSHFMFDIPAAVDAVRRKTGRPKIFYIGHSLGGMLGYGYAGLRDDLAGLIAIGSPSDLGRGWPMLRLIAHLEPGLKLGDLGYAVRNAIARTDWAIQTSAAWLGKRSSAARRLLGERKPPAEPTKLSFRRFHISKAGRVLGRFLAARGGRPLKPLFELFPGIWSPTRVNIEAMLAYFRESGEDEPRKAVAQFARWIRNDEMVCYKMSYDFKKGFKNIKIPMAIIFGDQDKLTQIASTRSVYLSASSEYLLWRPVRGNSHIEITLGHDLRQICYDIKNLIEYAVKQERKKGQAKAPA